MSTKELHPFFPSATHPALPVAVGLLSTLRALTAPGKGSALRREETMALVGVAALLACERIQSHDLVESTAQRLSSVAPTHFRSALAASRRVLAEVEATGRSSGASSSSRPGSSSLPSSPQAHFSSDLSPLLTPKKPFRYSLVSPARASPLRQSVTPSKRAREMESEGDEQGEGEGEGERTPTRPVRLTERLSAARTDKEKERAGAAAFLALRGGADSGRDPLAVLGLSGGRRRVRKIRKRADWTFKEKVWALPLDDDVFGEVPAVLVTDDDEPARKKPRGRVSKGTTGEMGALDSVILAAWV